MAWRRGDEPVRLGLLIASLLITLIVAVGMLAASAAQVSEEKARQIFVSKGCKACHNGKVAPSFDDTVKKIREWASKYSSLDDAVRAEYKYMGGAKSYDEMMRQMKKFTPQISDQEFKLLYDFFKQVFEQAKGGTAKKPAATKTATTTTTAATQTATATTTAPPVPVISLPPEATTTTTPPVTIPPSTPLNPYSAELHSAINSGVLAAVALLTIAAAAAIVIYYRR
jgi:cytochrome c551/c552